MARKNLKALPIGEQIQLYRESLGLTQRDLLEKIEKAGLRSGGDGTYLSKGGLSQLETNTRFPTLTTLRLLSKGLNCTFTITPKYAYIEELTQQ